MVSIKFPSQQKADAFVAMMKTSWLEKLENETLTVEQTVMKTGEEKIVGSGRYISEWISKDLKRIKKNVG